MFEVITTAWKKINYTFPATVVFVLERVNGNKGKEIGYVCLEIKVSPVEMATAAPRGSESHEVRLNKT